MPLAKARLDTNDERVGRGELSFPRAEWLRIDGEMAQLLGREDVSGLTLIDVTHPEDVAEDLHALERLRDRALDGYHRTKRILRRDRTDGRDLAPLWVSQMVWSVGEADGEVTRLRVQMTPLELREPQADFLFATLDSIGEAVIATDARGAVTLMNPVAEMLTGIEARDAIGRVVDDVVRLVSPVGTHKPSSMQARLGDGAIVTSLMLVARDGSERPVALTCAPLAASGGGMVLVLRDTTDEARAADALKRSEASFRTLIEASPELIVVHKDAELVYANASFVARLGYPSPSAIVGRHRFLDLVHPDDRAKAADLATRPTDVRWIGASGAVVHSEAVGMPVEFDGQSTTVVIGRDVTERNAIQARLFESDRMAALGTLAAGVAHEINNPLTYLLVNLEHVLRKVRALAASDDPAGELAGDAGIERLGAWSSALSQAVEGANRVRQIVRDLMTFSQGNVEHVGLVDLRGVVESAIQMAWHEIRHRARLVKNLAEVPPVEANEARLGQVFLSLLVNAAQAIPEGAATSNEVRVSTRTDDEGNAVVEIADTGLGIAADALPRVFDPFFTTKAPRTTGSGVGLGLSIAHGTVRGLGGEMVALSTPGKGSIFRVVLPPAKSWRGAGPSSRPSRLNARVMPRARVLVIDDEPLVCDAIARVLGDDCDVVSCSSAKDALDHITGPGAETFDVILCDLLMPVMTGMDLYAEVVRLAPQLAGRIVFMTGGAFTQRARAFLKSVSNPCLEKPLETSKLRSLVVQAAQRSGAAVKL